MSSTGILMTIALLLVVGIVLVLLRVNRVMDFSRTFFNRWRKDDRGDEGGIFTSYTHDEKVALDAERHRLGRSPIPEVNLRADLPTGTARDVNEKVARHQQEGVPPSNEMPAPGLTTSAGRTVTDTTADSRKRKS